jgi:hypothetical protein
MQPVIMWQLVEEGASECGQQIGGVRRRKMTLKLFVKCDKCGELSKASKFFIEQVAECSDDELEQMKYTSGACNAESGQKSIDKVFKNFGGLVL